MNKPSRLLFRILVLLIGCILLIGLFSSSTAVSQDNDEDMCSPLVEEALQQVGSSCAEIGLNEACYGNVALTTELVEDTDQRFERVGDRVDILDVKSLQTHPLDAEKGEWGVALMTVQPDIQDESDGSLLFVLFGDSELHDIGDPDSPPMHTITLSVNDTDTCQQVSDGLMVRSPDGVRARVTVNGVNLTFSSTGFIQAQPDGEMDIWVMDGQVEVEADGENVLVEADHHTVIPLDGFNPSGPPAQPEIFSQQWEERFQFLRLMIQILRDHLVRYFGEGPNGDLITLDSVGEDGSVLVELNNGFHCFGYQVPEGLPVTLFFSRGFLTEEDLAAAQSRHDSYLEINGEMVDDLEISTFIDHSLEDEMCCHLDHRYHWGTPPAGVYRFETGAAGISYECELVISN